MYEYDGEFIHYTCKIWEKVIYGDEKSEKLREMDSLKLNPEILVCNSNKIEYDNELNTHATYFNPILSTFMERLSIKFEAPDFYYMNSVCPIKFEFRDSFIPKNTMIKFIIEINDFKAKYSGQYIITTQTIKMNQMNEIYKHNFLFNFPDGNVYKNFKIYYQLLDYQLNILKSGYKTIYIVNYKIKAYINMAVSNNHLMVRFKSCLNETLDDILLNFRFIDIPMQFISLKNVLPNQYYLSHINLGKPVRIASLYR